MENEMKDFGGPLSDWVKKFIEEQLKAILENINYKKLLEDVLDAGKDGLRTFFTTLKQKVTTWDFGNWTPIVQSTIISIIMQVEKLIFGEMLIKV
jgi:hypothetical protein